MRQIIRELLLSNSFIANHRLLLGLSGLALLFLVLSGVVIFTITRD